MEELSRVDAGVALSVAAHNSLCSGHIFLAGTEEQKKKYLAPLARGEKVGCWGLTENSAGSDAGRHQDHGGARRRPLGAERLQDLHHQRPPRRHRGGHGGHRQEQGQEGHLRLRRRARDARASAPARRRTSSACAPPTPPSWCFEDCRIPAANLLGKEGNGFIDTLRILDRGRIGIAAFSLGIAQASLEASHDVRARAAGSSATPSPSSRPSSSRSRTWPRKVDAARLLTWRAAALRDAGQEHTVAVLHGQALRQRDRGRGRPGGRADPRRLRLHQGLPGGALPARLQARHHRRGHERGAAPGHRARAAAACAGWCARRPLAGAVRRTAALAAGVRAGDVRAMARAISLVEDGRPEAPRAAGRALPARRPRAGRRASPARPGRASPRSWTG